MPARTNDTITTLEKTENPVSCRLDDKTRLKLLAIAFRQMIKNTKKYRCPVKTHRSLWFRVRTLNEGALDTGEALLITRLSISFANEVFHLPNILFR